MPILEALIVCFVVVGSMISVGCRILGTLVIRDVIERQVKLPSQPLRVTEDLPSAEYSQRVERYYRSCPR